MKTKNLLHSIMSVIAATLFMLGSLLSQAATLKSDPEKQLKNHVEEAYYRYYDDPISISVNDEGVVELKGTVKSYWDKLNIFASVAKVKGVTEIIEDLLVVTENVPDNIIKDEILNQYQRTHILTEPEKIKVGVSNGLVILTGTANFYRESVAAEDIAGMFMGVKSVDNELDVLPISKAESDNNLALMVQDVLKDQFQLSSKNIQVNVNQEIVTLTGTTNTLWSKHAIEKQIHEILGVKDVINKLLVKSEFI
jgi:osmotically-inducible protein OsmY